MFGKNMVSLSFDYLCAKLLEKGGGASDREYVYNPSFF